jgi:hypothetical protein
MAAAEVHNGWRVEYGTARIVILTKKYAFKLPRVRLLKSWRKRSLKWLTEGLRANAREWRKWRDSRAEHLCPVLLALPFGLLVVMPRARSLNDGEVAILHNDYVAEGGAWSQPLRGDFKARNYGMLKGQRVKIDYEL